ncbi:methyltransferase domain-containing protein [candidate division KSB1 bacterium]
MKDHQDVYGHEVYDFYHAIAGYEIVERDDGYFHVSENAPACYFFEFKDWPRHHQRVMKYVKGNVLDVGCGPGRHIKYLVDNGFEYLGIDISPLALEVCRLRGYENVKNLHIGKVSKTLGKFDTILLLGNNFGLLRDLERANRRLKNFCSITNPGAVILVESIDFSKDKNPDNLEYLGRNKKRGRMPGQLRLRLRYKKYISEWFDYLQVSKDELKEIVKNTGWEIKKIIDSEDLRFIAVLEKV